MEGEYLRFARGGPIFVPDLIGPITSVADFEASLLSEIHSLEAELVSTDDFDDELLVDELRVFSEEELVERALSEGFGDASENVSALQSTENVANGEEMQLSPIPGKEIVCSENSAIQDDNLRSNASLSSSAMENIADGSSAMDNIADGSKNKLKRKRSKKRGRVFDRHSRATELEGSYLNKVKELAKIKKKQDKDKLAARLNSFSGNSISVAGPIPTSEKIEKMRSLRFITHPVKKKSIGSREHIPLCSPEVVLCVEIYHNKNSSQKTQEFLVLGSQVLSDLRDNIYCLTDKLMQTAGEHDPSGYFLIEDTFCNDLRDPSAIDYSQPIFNWLKNSNTEAIEKWEFIMSGELKKMQKELLGDADVSNLPSFKCTHMHRTRFCDLRFRLGAAYLYCHQGNCKHVMVIRDMRLAHPEDLQNRSDYPLRTFQIRPRHRKCAVCKIYQATKMTIDDKWAQKNPCYFCNICYFLLHYKEDGSLLYPHSVFDYYNEE